MISTSVTRFLAALAVLAAAAGVLLLLGDTVFRDQAVIFAAAAALATAASLSILVMPPALGDAHDTWESIPWGKLFVALVYASVAAFCLIAMTQAPDASRFAHALRAVL